MGKLSKYLVVDTDVACAASDKPQEQCPTAPNLECLDVLISILDVCHRVVFSEELTAEWDNHASNLSMQWTVSMEMMGKLERSDFPKQQTPLHPCTVSFPTDRQFQKNLHLATAALAADRIIISMDDRAKRRFVQMVPQCPILGTLTWVNPRESGIVDWLQKGCPEEPRWLLAAQADQ